MNDRTDKSTHERGHPLDPTGLSADQVEEVRDVARAMRAGLLDDFDALFAASRRGVVGVARERLAATHG